MGIAVDGDGSVALGMAVTLGGSIALSGRNQRSKPLECLPIECDYPIGLPWPKLTGNGKIAVTGIKLDARAMIFFESPGIDRLNPH